MARKSPVESLLSVWDAFCEAQTWRQKELAGRVGLEVPALRRLLLAHSERVPLTSVSEHPDVFWTWPRASAAGSTVLGPTETARLLAVLRSAPRSTERTELIARLKRAAPDGKVEPETRARSSSESNVLPMLEQSMATKVALHMLYFTASRGTLTWRHVSPCHLVADPPARFIAYCHRSSQLKWFRVEGVQSAMLDGAAGYRDVPAATVAEYRARSVDFFHENDAATVEEHTFVVDPSEARWVALNLPDNMRGEPLPDGRLRVRSLGLRPAARFVLSLGGAALPETRTLQSLTRALAERTAKSLEPESAPRRAKALR